jgi:hypothetical protein
MGPTGAPNGTGGAAGVLTAGIWDDRANFDFFGQYLSAHPAVPGDPGFATSDYSAAHDLFKQAVARKVVDAALVIDTTGSMGDEINYLTQEFANISNAIAAKFPGADQRWALVLYRDTPDTDPGDEYVTRTFPFTGDLQAFSATIAMQHASGGGDYPESPELGLAQLEQLSWRTGADIAKVAFWVGDAPHHVGREAGMKQALLDAKNAGIHIYPVSASGTDELLELTMRSAAELTGGRYMFLTDDSGVGDPHKQPEIPCYYVTKLETALVRAISMEIAGAYLGPANTDIIRTAGDPNADGTCTIAGQTLHAY